MPKKRVFRHISGIFPAFSAGKKFFPKIGLRHILGFAILHLCAKNQKKLMSRSREKLVTNERTNERTQVNLQDLRVGPKSGIFWDKMKSVLVNRLAFKDSKFLCWTAQFFLWTTIQRDVTNSQAETTYTIRQLSKFDIDNF